MVKFENVTKTYHTLKVIDKVNLTLSSKSTHVLIGPSGCGKSTLIRLATGLVDSDEGNITLNGTEVSAISDARKAEMYGYMIQDGGLFPHLTCEENIRLPSVVHGQNSDDFKKRFEDLRQMVALSSSLLKRYPRQISGGQRQRIALMRALILDPPILFLDEPLGALDPLVRSDLQTELKSIFSRLGKTVILVTHDLAEAAFFADTVTLLQAGRVEQHGTVDDLMDHPKSEFVSNYLKAQRPPPSLAKLTEKMEKQP